MASSSGPDNSPEPPAEGNPEPRGTWKRRWQQGLAFLPRLFQPWQSGLARFPGWFRIDDRQVAEILQEIRSRLPTTEAILVGKPQAGKSSVIRGLTGASADIIGQGFRPHTQHTQRYTYPTLELPLILFTDTVGLGESAATTEDIIQELLAEPIPSEAEVPKAAKILLLTVRITDFATAALAEVVRSLRQRHPEIPCLLVVTCLHDAYPAGVLDHPEYPPRYPDLERAFQALEQYFQGLYDRSVLIDFTLEADGYTPVFYGLEPLVEAITQLLPEAEANVLHQLLANAEAGNQVGALYREAGRRYILPFAVMAGTLAAVPLPLATMPILTTLQVTLVGLLGQLYGQTLTPSQAGGVVSAIAGGFVAQAIGRELVKFIPGLGSVIAASWAAAYTWSLGEAACVYFGDLMGGKQPNPERIRQVMADSLKTAQERFRSSLVSQQREEAPTAMDESQST